MSPACSWLYGVCFFFPTALHVSCNVNAHTAPSQLVCTAEIPAASLQPQSLAGLRQNNAAATRACRHGHGQKGRAFFADDEDEFGLASLLQALLFHETGRTTLTPKPWESAGGDAGSSRWIEREQELPDDVQQQLRFLRGAGAGGLEAESSNGAL